jgi:hypothetical protein
MRNRYLSAAALLAAALLFCAATAAHAQGVASAAAANKNEANKAGDFYSCPMHPEVKSKKKGRCPKCKMDLRLTHAQPKPSDEATNAGMSEAGSMNASAARKNATRATRHAPSKMTIPDVELLDQDGNKVRFYTDLVKGRTVAINFIFTTCTTICPPLGATFARVQKELGERAGRDVQLISVSVDPATDTPERMKAWGAKFHAAAGWTFVTGRSRRWTSCCARSARRRQPGGSRRRCSSATTRQGSGRAPTGSRARRPRQTHRRRRRGPPRPVNPQTREGVSTDNEENAYRRVICLVSPFAAPARSARAGAAAPRRRPCPPRSQTRTRDTTWATARPRRSSPSRRAEVFLGR